MQKTGKVNHGFTLVELSVVLVIVGMIVAGILLGKDLLGHSKIVSVVQEFTTYQSGYQKFLDKYQELPGDMVDANNYFDPTGTICGTSAVVSSNRAGCNGNSDGVINGGNNGNDYKWREGFRGWQHMTLAGVISANVTGQNFNDSASPREYSLVPGTANVPTSGAFVGAGYDLFTGLSSSSPSTSIQSVNAHFLRLGKVSGSTLTGAALTRQEAIAIDQKMDDGKANTGLVLGANGTGGSCLSGTAYNPSERSQADCVLAFVLQRLQQ